MFIDIVDLLKIIYTSDFFFDLFTMVWTLGIVGIVFSLIRGL